MLGLLHQELFGFTESLLSSVIVFSNNKTTAFMYRYRIILATALAVPAVIGCERAEPVQWASSKAVSALPDEALQAELAEILKQHSGTAAAPKLVTDDEVTFDESRHLKHGQAVYMKRCVQCHGVSGDGNGPAAEFLYPRPRDYTKAIFKFTSTQYGNRPRRSDLVKTVQRGVAGTSMPSFDLLSSKDIEAVVDYIMVLSQRGELEEQLAIEADASEELDPEYLPDIIDLVKTRWASATETFPISEQPEFTPEVEDLGRKAFLSKGCSGCHGEDGRGHTLENFKRKDSWGYPTRAADLTSGMLRGGQKPIDVYRRILNGINGTPMPGFRHSLQKEPETIWHLVAFVLKVNNQRRFGAEFTAGMMQPYGEMTGDAEGE